MKKYSGPRNLENNISKLIKPILKKKKDHFRIINDLRKNWQEIIGEKYYQYCYPKKVTINQDKKAVLFIGSYNSAVAFALEGNQNIILEKIASHFGYKIISNIKISQELKEIKLKKKEKKIKLDTKDENLIQENIKNIKDESLKDVLHKLGQSIFNKKTD